MMSGLIEVIRKIINYRFRRPYDRDIVSLVTKINIYGEKVSMPIVIKRIYK